MTITSKTWFYLIAFALSYWLIHLLAPILMPFLVATILAYLFDPVADRLEKHKFSRTWAVVCVFVVFFAAILLLLIFLVPVLESQIKQLAQRLPDYLAWAGGMLDKHLQQSFSVQVKELSPESVRGMLADNFENTRGVIGNALKAISKSGLWFFSALANLALIPVIMFYLLRDWDRLISYINDLLPRDIQPVVANLATESDEMLGAFLRGQILVMMGLGTIYAIGLSLVGVEFAILIGLIAGLVSFVPYLGFIVGIAIAGLAVIFQTQDAFQLFWVVLVFGVAQVIEGTVLTPLLVGERIGLHPVSVIFAVLAGGQLFGFFGVLLALPVAAVLVVLMRHLHDSYINSQIYSLR